jgi:hypothetical protein
VRRVGGRDLSNGASVLFGSGADGSEAVIFVVFVGGWWL